MKHALLRSLHAICWSLLSVLSPFLWGQSLPSQAISRQVREFKLEAGATSAKTSFIFTHEKNAILSMQFLTKDLSLVVTDPNGKRIPWDEKATDVDCSRFESPHPEDEQLTLYSYHMVTALRGKARMN